MVSFFDELSLFIADWCTVMYSGIWISCMTYLKVDVWLLQSSDRDTLTAFLISVFLLYSCVVCGGRCLVVF